MRIVAVLVTLASSSSGLAAEPAAAEPAVVTPVLTRNLADFPGKEAVMITVEYAPGAESPPHRHDAHTFVYVLEGSVVMQVEGGPEVTLKPGESFYEAPADIHVVSRNASRTAPAKFLVFFLKEAAKPASTPITISSPRSALSP